jgi:hypothetical protein
MSYCDFFKLSLRDVCGDIQHCQNKNGPIILSGSLDFAKVRGNMQIVSETLIWLFLDGRQMKESRLGCVQNASAAAYLSRSPQSNFCKPFLCVFFFSCP